MPAYQEAVFHAVTMYVIEEHKLFSRTGFLSAKIDGIRDEIAYHLYVQGFRLKDIADYLGMKNTQSARVLDAVDRHCKRHGLARERRQEYTTERRRLEQFDKGSAMGSEN